MQLLILTTVQNELVRKQEYVKKCQGWEVQNQIFISFFTWCTLCACGKSPQIWWICII